MKHLKYLVVLLITLTGLAAGAQTKPVVKFKPPALTTIMGGHKDSASITVADAERIVGEKIYVSDAKKQVYTISSYQFAYRKLGVTEDEITEKISPTYTLQATTFKSTPIAANWMQQVREQVKAGDELWFFDVIVKDAQGRVMYAPDVKFKVK